MNAYQIWSEPEIFGDGPKPVVEGSAMARGKISHQNENYNEGTLLHNYHYEAEGSEMDRIRHFESMPLLR